MLLSQLLFHLPPEFRTSCLQAEKSVETARPPHGLDTPTMSCRTSLLRCRLTLYSTTPYAGMRSQQFSRDNVLEQATAGFGHRYQHQMPSIECVKATHHVNGCVSFCTLDSDPKRNDDLGLGDSGIGDRRGRDTLPARRTRAPLIGFVSYLTMPCSSLAPPEP